MLHYVHQLDANVVSLMFGAQQIAYSGFSRPFLLKNNTDECIDIELKQ